MTVVEDITSDFAVPAPVEFVFTVADIVEATNRLKAAHRYVRNVRTSGGVYGRLTVIGGEVRLVTETLYLPFQASVPIIAVQADGDGDVAFRLDDLIAFLKPYKAAWVRKNGHETFTASMVPVGEDQGETSFRVGTRERTFTADIGPDRKWTPDEWYTLPTNLTVPVDVFAEVQPAISKDEGRPVINAVSFNSGFVRSTDSYRVFEVDGVDFGSDTYEPFLVPKFVVDLIVRAKTGAVKVGVGSSELRRDLQVVFGDGLVLHAECVEGAFPNVESVVDGVYSQPAKVTVDRAEMLAGIDMIRNGGIGEDNTPLRFDVDANTLSISNGATTETIDLPKTADLFRNPDAHGMVVGYNPAYISDLLDGLDDVETVGLWIDPQKPTGLVMPRSNGGTRRRVLMPVRLR